MTFSPRRSVLLGLLTATLTVAALSAAAQGSLDKPRELKVSTAVGPAFALGAAGERWAKLIAERGGGKLVAKLYPGAALAQRDPAREFLALRDGPADLAVGSTLFWGLQVAELNVVGLPWIVPDPKALDALIAGAMKQRFDAALVRAGVVPLAYAALGTRALATATVDVQTPDDLAGIAVRVTSTPLLYDVFRVLGAKPTAMAFADAQREFAAGTLGAQDGTPATFAAARLDALGIRRVVLWGAVAEVAVFAVNRTAWTGLTDAERGAVRDAALQAAAELPELARAENDAALDELRKRGVTITRLTASGRAAFAFAARSAYDKWAAAAGRELVGEAEAAIKAANP
jgi:TRAP-type C4-dicarboxylate transport system substrate-binding protein